MSSSKLFSIIVRAKGDLLAGTSADDLDRLPVGTNGQVLTANSATATGLAWTTPSGGGGGASLSDANPANLGTTAPGTGSEASRSDHVHDMPSAAEVGADATGTAAGAISSHEGAADPHPIYLTGTEGDAAYAALAHSHGTAGSVSMVSHYVKNDAVAKTKGEVVYISGANGTNAIISYADADTEPTSSKTFGLLAQDLAANAFGYVITEGVLTGISTSGAAAGDRVWLSSTPGGRVYGSAPAKPAHSVFLGHVTRVNANNGEMIVTVQNGYELGELHNVSLSNGNNTTGDVLAYNATTQLWGASTAVIDLTTTVAGKVASVSATSPITSTGGTTPTIAINDGSTSAKGAVQLEDSTSSTSTTTAATPASVKSAYDLANAAIPKSLANAKGDIVTATGDNTPAILSVGTEGQVLSASAAAATGLAWVPLTADVQEFDASGSWTKPAGAKAVYVLAIGAGGGGSSGAKATANVSMFPGNGGSGGQGVRGMFPASLFASPTTVTIGAGGNGGTAVTAAAGNGNTGFDGGATSFGSITAAGGKGAVASTAFTTVHTMTANAPLLNISNQSVTSFPGYSQNTQIYDGTAKGGLSADPAAAPSDAVFMAGGGGQGGVGKVTALTGSTGVSARGAGGLGMSGSVVGGASAIHGANGSAPTTTAAGAGGGGGGGDTENAGTGGAGYRGGGGGGGGSAKANSGAGGKGGDGYVLVITLR